MRKIAGTQTDKDTLSHEYWKTLLKISGDKSFTRIAMYKAMKPEEHKWWYDYDRASYLDTEEIVKNLPTSRPGKFLKKMKGKHYHPQPRVDVYVDVVKALKEAVEERFSDGVTLAQMKSSEWYLEEMLKDPSHIAADVIRRNLRKNRQIR